jgi:hypothetical protein
VGWGNLGPSLRYARVSTVGWLDSSQISQAAWELLLDRLSRLLTQNATELTDSDTGLTLTAYPWPDTVVNGEDGTVTSDGPEWASPPPHPRSPRRQSSAIRRSLALVNA